MQAGEGGSAWRPPKRSWLGLLLWLSVGCAICRPPIDRAILADKGMATRSENVAEAQPPHREATFTPRPMLTGRHAQDVVFDGWHDLLVDMLAMNLLR